MKIHNPEQILRSLYPETKSKTRPSADKEFNTILNETVGNSKKETMGTHRTTFVNPLNGAQMQPSPVTDTLCAIDRTEKLIDLLDQYRQKLAKPGNTLRSIDPIVREIDKETANLAPILESLPEGEALKKIVNQTMITASLEVTRFYRGDYITS
jgi:hypothetical protein